jgi:hypothetical protein
MSDVGMQVAVATESMSHSQQKLRGAEALKLIDGAAGAGGGQQRLSSPPPQPVSVTPRAGSTVEVVA